MDELGTASQCRIYLSKIMSDSDLLYPWAIYRLHSHLKHCAIARFRRRNDSEAYLTIVQHMIPQAEFAIVFDLSIAQIRNTTDEKPAEHASMID
ncbi:MAG: hypothetical protein F6K28_48055 [Microcoleus sp. SIO2G3]|nr:hypothetical protein [Microcoleus sp. SIO2G3]